MSRWYARHRLDVWVGVYLAVFAGPVIWGGLEILARHAPVTIWLQTFSLVFD